MPHAVRPIVVVDKAIVRKKKILYSNSQVSSERIAWNECLDSKGGGTHRRGRRRYILKLGVGVVGGAWEGCGRVDGETT